MQDVCKTKGMLQQVRDIAYLNNTQENQEGVLWGEKDQSKRSLKKEKDYSRLYKELEEKEKDQSRRNLRRKRRIKIGGI